MRITDLIWIISAAGFMFLTVASLAVFIWKKSDGWLFATKCLATLTSVCALVFCVRLCFSSGLDFIIPIPAAVFGYAIAILWTRTFLNTLVAPLMSIFDGGSLEPEAVPLYSIAESKRKRSLFDEAIREIRGQLEKFPDDFTGNMMLASIMAEDLNDLPGAQHVIEHLLAKPGCPPNAVSGALQTLADWHLRYAMDPEAALAALQRIIDTFPDTQWSQMASQRIARLPSAEQLMERRERAPIAIPLGRRNIGLQSDAASPETEPNPAALADGYVKQLQKHPLDTDAREKLAMLYAEHFQRPDLAIDQIEQLIDQPAETAKRVVGWLNLLATIHLQHSNNISAAEEPLRRIMTRFPRSAAAEMAMTRLATLKSELKRNEKSQVKQLGSYEHDMGLKPTA